MGYLLFVSLIWAFSFGLIKGNLTGIDPNFVAFGRLAVSLLVFLPLWKIRKIEKILAARLILTGTIQFGLMYIFYLAAFQTLKAYEVALFTIFTPLFVTLIDDIFERHFNWVHLVSALIAIAGTWIIVGEGIQSHQIVTGFLLVQASNLCYAFGQIYYRRIMVQHSSLRDRDVFGFLYLGATIITAIVVIFFVPIPSIQLTGKQWLTIGYLGAVASGLGFFLWNLGARKVNTGTLAVFNDLKIPLAVVVSLVFFKENTNIPVLISGGAIIMLALAINEANARRTKLNE